MAADPVVSPADTPAAFNMRQAMLDDAKVKLAQIRDEPRFELLLPSEAEEVLRALAVGERDKAELKLHEQIIHGYSVRVGELESAGERDRRQIARLTEALEQIAAPAPPLSFRGSGPIFSDTLQGIARAVLAGEEDAGE